MSAADQDDHALAAQVRSMLDAALPSAEAQRDDMREVLARGQARPRGRAWLPALGLAAAAAGLITWRLSSPVSPEPTGNRHVEVALSFPNTPDRAPIRIRVDVDRTEPQQRR